MSATDRLDLLRLFVRVAETGSISEAARGVGLSQPSASRALKLLEGLARTQLVARNTHNLSLTPPGRAFLEHAHRLLAGWDAALGAAQAERQDVSGHIRVIAPVAVGQVMLARIAARFIALHPDVTINWNLRDGPLDMMSADCDLWIRAGDPPPDDLVVRRVYEIRRVIVAHPGASDASHPRELVARPAVRLTSFVPPSVRLQHASGSDFVLRQNTIFATDNLYAANVAAMEGIGYAILPLWLVQGALDQGSLAVLCTDWQPPTVQLSLAYPPSARSARLRAFIEFMHSELTGASGSGIAFLRELGALDSIALT